MSLVVFACNDTLHILSVTPKDQAMWEALNRGNEKAILLEGKVNRSTVIVPDHKGGLMMKHVFTPKNKDDE